MRPRAGRWFYAPTSVVGARESPLRVGALAFEADIFVVTGCSSAHQAVWSRLALSILRPCGNAGVRSLRGRPAASVKPSERLGNLAQTRGPIRVKPANACRLLDHPVGRNDHGH